MQLVHLTDLKAWGHWGDEVSLQPMPMSDVHVHVSQVLQACKAHLIALKRRGAVCITCQGHASDGYDRYDRYDRCTLESHDNGTATSLVAVASALWHVGTQGEPYGNTHSAADEVFLCRPDRNVKSSRTRNVACADAWQRRK